MHPIILIPALILSVLVFVYLRRQYVRLTLLRREQAIRNYVFPPRLFEPLLARHPHLQIKDCQLVAQGLRQFFMAYHKSGYRYVSMPSQVVDDLWHEFILHTQAYQDFCSKAFGRFLHHTPVAALGQIGAKQSDAGLRRSWWHACREENLNPNAALRLPLLFALDAKLTISAGFLYVLDCQGVQRAGSGASSGAVVYCAGDFFAGNDHSGSDTASYAGDSDSSSTGDSGGDSNGCGGGGCGGGGCGGGGGD